MGSPCEVQLFAAEEAQAQRAISAVVADVERLEQLYSRYRDSSFLSTINRVAAKGGSIEVDSETTSLLNYAGACYDQSDGQSANDASLRSAGFRQCQQQQREGCVFCQIGVRAYRLREFGVATVTGLDAEPDPIPDDLDHQECGQQSDQCRSSGRDNGKEGGYVLHGIAFRR